MGPKIGFADKTRPMLAYVPLPFWLSVKMYIYLSIMYSCRRSIFVSFKILKIFQI